MAEEKKPKKESEKKEEFKETFIKNRLKAINEDPNKARARSAAERVMNN